MTMWRQDFEGGSNGTTISFANSGGAGRTAVTPTLGGGSTAVYTTTSPIVGGMSASVSAASAATGFLELVIPAGANRYAAAAAVFRVTAAPGTSYSLAQLRSSATRSLSVGLNSNGTVKFSSNNVDLSVTSALSFPATFVVDVQTDSGTTSSDGKIRYALLALDGTFMGGMTGYGSNTGLNTGTGILVDRWRVVGTGTEAVVRAAVVDEMRIGNTFDSVWLPQPYGPVLSSKALQRASSW